MEEGTGLKKLIAGLALLVLALTLYSARSAPALAGDTDASGTIGATATAKAKVTLTIDPMSIPFGDLYPEATSTATVVAVTIKHNVPVSIAINASPITGATPTNVMPFSALSLNSTPFDTTGAVPGATLSNRGVDHRSDSFTVTVPWDVAPDAYGTTITYTVTGS